MGDLGPPSGAIAPFGSTWAGQRAGSRLTLIDRGRRLFEFLAAAQRLRVAPIRTTESYERDGAVFWLGELPEHCDVTTSLREGGAPAGGAAPGGSWGSAGRAADAR